MVKFAALLLTSVSAQAVSQTQSDAVDGADGPSTLSSVVDSGECDAKGARSPKDVMMLQKGLVQRKTQISADEEEADVFAASVATESNSTGLLTQSQGWTSRVGKCGIAANVGKCQEEYNYLASLDSAGDTHAHINCMGYGGPSDPCTLSITNDGDAGLSKNPKNCHDGALFLWDEPYTQSERGHASWGSAAYQAGKWKEYANRWTAELQEMRAAGMKVTSPMFTQKSGRQVTEVMKSFLESCGGGCSDPSAPEYIDVLIWNAWIGDWSPDTRGQVDWIKNIARQMKRENSGRPVWLGNFGFLGTSANVARQIDVIENSGIFDMDDGALDAVYYFAARDYGGGIPHNSNLLTSARSDGSTVGEALLRKCRKYSTGAPSGGTDSVPSSPSVPPSPPPSPPACEIPPECTTAVNWAMNEGIHTHSHWYPGLTADSSFDEFQALLHRGGHGGCPAPCSA